jgi:hypothetical protein
MNVTTDRPLRDRSEIAPTDKPLLRGVSHQLAFFVSVAAGLVLVMYVAHGLIYSLRARHVRGCSVKP